jgi:hypothetical protein
MPERHEESPKPRPEAEPSEQHVYQPYNVNGNSCHYPGCAMKVHDHLPAVPDGAR